MELTFEALPNTTSLIRDSSLLPQGRGGVREMEVEAEAEAVPLLHFDSVRD